MPVENFTLPPCGTAERPGEEQKRVPHHEQQEQDGHGGMEVAGGELHGLGHECAHRAIDEFGQEEFFGTGEREFMPEGRMSRTMTYRPIKAENRVIMLMMSGILWG